jgi:tetratricopeptide (TPR) repeat protein
MTPGEPPANALDTTISVAERVARATADLIPGGLNWARAMDELAEEFLQVGGLADANGPVGRAVTSLDAAIGIRRGAIERLDAGQAATVGLDLRNNLAVDLASRYQAGGGLGDLLESCALSREVLTGAAPGDLLTAAAGLAGRLSLLARNPGYEAELDRAIRLLADILDQADPDDQGRPIVVTSLAGLELHRWQRDGDPAVLTAAARAAPRNGTVTGATPGAVNVAALLLEQAEQAHDTGVLSAGEALLRAVIADGSPRDAIAARGSLAVTLVTRFDLEGGEGLLTEAIEWADAAVDAAPPGPSRAEDLSARAAARAALARLRGEPELLDAAIADARAAVAEPATYAADPSGPVNSLAMLLAERYDLLGDSVNLDESIALHERILANPAVAVDGRPAILSNLANGLLSRFERDWTARARLPRALADLQRAAGLADEAITRTPPGSVQLPARHDTAGRIRAALGYHLGPVGTPGADGTSGPGEVAERHARAAVAATPEASPDRAHYLNNWAMWVTDRWERTADPAARTGVQGIGALAALCATRAGNTAAAALHLEQASATLLAESLGVRADTVTFADITTACRAMRRTILFLGSTPAGGRGAQPGRRVPAGRRGDCHGPGVAGG